MGEDIGQAVQAKELAALANTLRQAPERVERALIIEAVEGGFLVTRNTRGLYSAVDQRRTVVPDGDCLGSLVLKWAGEGQQGG